MAKKLIIGIGIVCAIALVATCVYISDVILGPSREANAREGRIRGAQEELARQFGVRLRDFPPITDFPTSYFVTRLKPGMPPDEVHTIVQGYEQAFSCGARVEIYDFFDTGADRFRIEVRYEAGGFAEIVDEDPYVHNIDTYPGCSKGLLPQ